MATFGQGVNPQLSAINYAPYSQGVAQGSAAIGRGIASLGAGLGQGIEQFVEIKQKNKELESSTKAVVDFLEGYHNTPNPDPEIQRLTIKPLGFLTDPGKSPRERAAYAAQVMGEYNSLVGSGFKAKQLENERVTSEAHRLAADAAMLAAQRERAGNPSDRDMLFDKELQGFIEKNQRRPTAQETAEIAKAAYAPARMYASPEELARAEELKTESNSAVKYLDEVAQRAFDSASTQATNNEGRKLLMQPNVEAGAGQEYITKARALAARAGFGDPAKITDQQTAEAFIATDQLNQAVNLIKGQGQISDSERNLISSTAANINKTKEANLKILDLRDALGARAQGAEEERQRLFDLGKTSRQTAEGVKRWYAKNTLNKFMDAIPSRKPNDQHDYSGADKIVGG